MTKHLTSEEQLLVGIIFIGLQLWWIGMTIRNGKVRVSTNESQIDEMKKKFEKIFNS